MIKFLICLEWINFNSEKSEKKNKKRGEKSVLKQWEHFISISSLVQMMAGLVKEKKTGKAFNSSVLPGQTYWQQFAMAF